MGTGLVTAPSAAPQWAPSVTRPAGPQRTGHCGYTGPVHKDSQRPAPDLTRAPRSATVSASEHRREQVRHLGDTPAPRNTASYRLPLASHGVHGDFSAPPTAAHRQAGYTRPHAHICTCTRMHTPTHVYMHAHVHTPPARAPTHAHTHARPPTPTHTHTICTHVHAHPHVHVPPTRIPHTLRLPPHARPCTPTRAHTHARPRALANPVGRWAQGDGGVQSLGRPSFPGLGPAAAHRAGRCGAGTCLPARATDLPHPTGPSLPLPPTPTAQAF